MDKLKSQQHRDSTRQNYYRIWKAFNTFLIRLDQKLRSWERQIILFMGFLINKRRKSNTIRSYISAIKAVLMENNTTINEDKYSLSLLTKACKYKNDKLQTRLPIHKKLLNVLLEKTNSYFTGNGQLYLVVLYQAMLAAGYYSLLRISEITSGRFHHPVLAKDVQIGTNKNKLLFILWTSKTHWKDEKPQIVKISVTSASINMNETCLFNIIRNYTK